jgi:hypothetical protein
VLDQLEADTHGDAVVTGVSRSERLPKTEVGPEPLGEQVAVR